MKKTLRALIGIAAMALACAGSSAALALQEGRDFEVINPPQSTETGKIEVIEFFSYMCPHCDHFDPVLNNWLKAQPKDVVFRRIPVVFRPQWEAPARLFFALEAMTELDKKQMDKLHTAAFTAVHREGANLMTESGVTDWAVKMGLDRKKFSDTYNSFAVQSKATGSKQKQSAYGIPGVPAMVVAGKYRTPDNFSGGNEAMLKIVDDLIVKSRNEMGKK
jgi:thiol:disulfide interchange protein DsbA